MWLRGEQPRPAGGFIYETTSFPECHASTLVETSDGIAAAWFGGTEEGHPDVGIWWSRLGPQGGWEAPVLVAEGVQAIGADGKQIRFPCWNPVLVPTPEEGLFLF
jgi:predicted neuraminidase